MSEKLNPIVGEVFYVDKPLHWTSFYAVKHIRGVLQKRLGMKKLKVGHAGTLDPLATGVLIVCTGRATKRIDELQAHVKEYVATVKLGATTPSFDLETEIDAPIPGNTSRARKWNACCKSGSPEASSRCPRHSRHARSMASVPTRWLAKGVRWS